jgi:sugar lactone lactonase YvrE
VEPLEWRLTPSTLLPIADHRALVFDDARDTLYVTTSSGRVQRFDAAHQVLLPAWTVGTSLNGADVTPDGTALYVAEGALDPASRTAFIHKVRLADGQVTDLPFALSPYEGAAQEVVVGADGAAFCSTPYVGSGYPVRLRQVDLATDAVTAREDFGYAWQAAPSLLARSADHAHELLVAANRDAFLSYDAAAHAFSTLHVVNTNGLLPAVNRDGTLFALQAGSSSLWVLDRDFRPVRSLTAAAAAFDPLHDVLYAAEAGTNQVVAYDTHTWAPRYRLDVGEAVPGWSPLGNGEMAVSGDGRYLFLATGSGVRELALPRTGGATGRFDFTAMPSLLAAGDGGAFTLSALDPAGDPTPGYAGTAQLGSSDPQAVFLDAATGLPLPGGRYTFRPEDQGAHPFQVLLSAPGGQSLSAADPVVGAGGAFQVTVHAGPLTLLPVADQRSMVFDPGRGLLYLATAHGTVERYDVARQALLAPLRVGASLNGADLSPDGQSLYVTDRATGLTRGVVHQVNLNTGAVTDLTYPLTLYELGSYSIVAEGNGKAFFDGRSATSGYLPLRQIDLATGALSVGSAVGDHTRFFRSADRSYALWVPGSSAPSGTIAPYDATADSVLWGPSPEGLPPPDAGSDTPVALNRDGSLIALGLSSGSHAVSVVERSSYRVARNLGNADGGLAFDPARDLLYVAEPPTGQVVAYDTNTWRRAFALDIGEAIAPATVFGNGTMTVSADGTLLFLATASGVRVLRLPQSTGVVSRFGLGGMPTLLAAGDTAAFTLTALDPVGNRTPRYAGTAQLGSSDPQAVFLDPATGLPLPGGRYTFRPQDQGAKALAVVLRTPGTHSLTAGDDAAHVSGRLDGVGVHAGPVTLLPVADHRGLVFDRGRGLLYVTTTHGTVERYDVARQALLEPLRIGPPLAGAGLSPDGRSLYVTEIYAGSSEGRVWKVDLASGGATPIRLAEARDALSLAVAGNGQAFVTRSNPYFPVLSRIDLATDTSSVLRGVAPSNYALPSGDASLVFFFSYEGSGTRLFTYRAATGTFSATARLDQSYSEAGAVNRDGSLMAVDGLEGVTVVNRSLRVLRTLPGLKGGVAFDPVRDLLYAVDTTAGQVVAYDTVTWQRRSLSLPTDPPARRGLGAATGPGHSAIPVGEAVGTAEGLGDGEMTVSPDGGWLFLATASGVRVYPLNDRVYTAAGLSASPASPGTAGQPVVFTATVSGGHPGGRQGQPVLFLDGQAVLGSAPLDARGRATFTTTALPVGTHAVTALYAGDGDNNPSASAALAYRIRPPRAPTSLSVTTTQDADPNAPDHEIVTFHVTLSGGDPADRDGEFVALPGAYHGVFLDASGHGTTLGSFPRGTYQLTASYAGDDRYEGSSTAVPFQVDTSPDLLLVLRADPELISGGQSVTFTADLLHWRAHPSEAITFRDGGAVLGTGPLDSSGRATFTTAALQAGAHVIVADYAGDEYNPARSTPLTFPVLAPSTRVVLQNPPPYAQPGSPVTLIVSVLGGATADRQGEAVLFLDGAVTLGQATLNAFGNASLTTSFQEAGDHVLRAVYAGDGRYHAGVATAAVPVFPSVPFGTRMYLGVYPTDLASDGSTQYAGRPVALLAQVTDGRSDRAGEPVLFYDRGLLLGVGALDAAGYASCDVPGGLDEGEHALLAIYQGDGRGSGPCQASRDVNAIVPTLRNTTTRVTMTPPDGATVGTAVTFTADVGGVFSGGPPTMGVTFRDGDQVLATVPLTLSGGARAEFTTAALGLGSHRIVATLNGLDDYVSSTGEVIAVIRTPATTPTDLALAADPPDSAAAGQPVTLTATVGGDVAARAGEEVTFWDGGTLLGTATFDDRGRATFTATALVSGNHRLRAVFGGDLAVLGSEASLDYTVVEAP